MVTTGRDNSAFGLRWLFSYKNDNPNTAQFGLIAEQVAQVEPNLVVRDKDRQSYSVRYDQVNAMLLNEL